MTYSLMNSQSPWDSARNAHPRAEARRAAGHGDAWTAVEDHDGAPNVMDDGLVCLLFDD